MSETSSLDAAGTRAEQRGETDATETYDGDSCARKNLCGIDHCTDTGHDRTAT